MNTWNNTKEPTRALATTPSAPTQAQINQHATNAIYTQDKLLANLEALLARVDKNSKTQNESRKAIETAIENSKKEAAKDLSLIAPANVEFIKRQNDASEQLTIIKEYQGIVDSQVHPLLNKITYLINGMNNFTTTTKNLTTMMENMDNIWQLCPHK